MQVERMGDWTALRSRSSEDAFLSLIMTKSQTPAHKRNGDVISGIHELHFTPSPHKSKQDYMNMDDVFCTRDNIDQCVAYLNQELTMVGFKSMYQNNSDTFDMVVMVNNMHELLKLHQKSSRIREDLETNKQRTDNDIDHLQQHTVRLKETCKEYEREIGRFEEKERQVLNKNKSLVNKLKAEKDEVKRLLSVIAHRDAQFKHDQKKKEREINKLKERLHQQLTDKNQERRIGMDILNSLQRSDGKRGTWKTGSKHEEDMYRLIIGNYEEKQKELMVENDQLRQCLRELQRELISVVNHQPESPLKSEPGLLQDSTIVSEKDDDAVSVSTSQSVDELSEGYFNMPVDMVREGIEKSFKEKCRHLKEVVRGSYRKRLSVGSPESLPSSIEHTEKLGQQLEDKNCQLERYKDIIEQQEKLIQTLQIPAMTENFSSSFFNDSELLEEKNQLTEERKLFYQQKANFEDERRNFTDAAIRLGRERKTFEEERASFLQQQFLNITPFTASQKATSRTSSIRKTSSTKGPVADVGAKLVPSTPCFSPAPKLKDSTPSTTELYRTLGLRLEDQKENRSSNSSSRNNSPRSFPRDFSTTSSGKSSSRKSSTASRSASKTSNTRVAEHVDNLKLALFQKKRTESNS
ncbi:afadin- and alpha-actinin-binding protein B-like [Lineus longissimus]|uniref:afadin- and alpha-actinin-binding protein B-like n=1 Tax=Lineus longissimus TaxID=88925 RepID=UPI002B4F4529